MTTTLFEAQPYDFAKARRRRIWISSVIIAVLVIGFLLWWYRFLPYERRVDHFFDAIQSQNFEQAYGIWMNDPQWKQHQDKYPRYPYHDFYIDWGPGGEWGLVKEHHIDGAASPHGGGSGVVVVVTVNKRAEPARIWVEKSDKTLHFSPY